MWSFFPRYIHDFITCRRGAKKGFNRIIYPHEDLADVTMTHLSFPSGVHAHVFVSYFIHSNKKTCCCWLRGRRFLIIFLIAVQHAHKIHIGVDGVPVPSKADVRNIALARGSFLSQNKHFIIIWRHPTNHGYEGLRVLSSTGRRCLDGEIKA